LLFFQPKVSFLHIALRGTNSQQPTVNSQQSTTNNQQAQPYRVDGHHRGPSWPINREQATMPDLAQVAEQGTF
jgi:hypothetical protein